MNQADRRHDQQQENGRSPPYESSPCSARRGRIGARCHVLEPDWNIVNGADPSGLRASCHSHRAQTHAIFLPSSGNLTPSLRNSSIIAALNLGMSSGFLLVTIPPSTITSWSTHVPPALWISVFSEGHEVIVRPATALVSISVHGPWQIAAMGL